MVEAKYEGYIEEHPRVLTEIVSKVGLAVVSDVKRTRYRKV